MSILILGQSYFIYPDFYSSSTFLLYDFVEYLAEMPPEVPLALEGPRNSIYAPLIILRAGPSKSAWISEAL